MNKNQKGFGSVEILLVTIVLLLSIGIGYLVYSKNLEKEEPSSSTQVVDTNQTVNESDESQQDDWLEYKTSGYTIKFADGWKLMKKSGSNDSFFTIDNSLELIPGKTAIIEEYVETSPGEFIYGFHLDYHLETHNHCSSNPFTKPTFKTNQGVDVYTSFSEGANEDTGLKSGDKQYIYCIQLSNNYVLSSGYSIESSEKDNSSVIEQVLKTVQAL